MIFAHTWKWIAEPSPHTGQVKTQTRRLVAIKDTALSRPDGAKIVLTEGTKGAIQSVYANRGNSLLWQVERTYAVQPAGDHPVVWWRESKHKHIYRNGRSGNSIDYAHTNYDLDPDVETPDYNLLRHDTGELYEYGYQPLRIRITGIRREDVRTISIEDAQAEGYATRFDFLQAWVQMHDKEASRWMTWFSETHGTGFQVLTLTPHGELCYYTPYAYLMSRPTERYQAWVLSFEVAQCISRELAAINEDDIAAEKEAQAAGTLHADPNEPPATGRKEAHTRLFYHNGSTGYDENLSKMLDEGWRIVSMVGAGASEHDKGAYILLTRKEYHQVMCAPRRE